MFRWTLHLSGGPKRALNAALAVGHRVYSFGGYCAKEPYFYEMGQIEVQVFNTVSLRWMKLPPVTTGRGECPLEVPYMRDGHTAVLIEDIIYIWGGVTIWWGVTIWGQVMHTWEYHNGLYAFDVHTHRWFKPKVSGTVPGARCGHSACVLGKVMYVFGGLNLLTGCNNDIYKLDTFTMVWSLINTRGTPAPVSGCHSATIIGTKMFVFGGQAGQVEINYDNINVFDTETNCWLSAPSAHLLPEGRGGHSAFAYNGELYIFGGDNCLLYRTFNDLWKFNPKTFSWKKVEPKGKGPCSRMSRMCCCMVGDHIILFGGYRYTPIPVDVNKVPDLYILYLSPSLKMLSKLAVIQYGLEQSGLPQDIRWELSAMTCRCPAFPPTSLGW